MFENEKSKKVSLEKPLKITQRLNNSKYSSQN